MLNGGNMLRKFYGKIWRILNYNWFTYGRNPQKHWEKHGRSSYEWNKPLEKYQEKEIKFVTEEVRKLQPKSILEIGCGWGRLTKPIAESLNPEKYIAIDFSHERLEIAKEKLKNTNVVLMYYDVTKGLPFLDDSFDLVCTFGCLMHIPPKHIEKVVSEIKRVTRKHIIHSEDLEKIPHYKYGYDFAEKYGKDKNFKIIKSDIVQYMTEKERIELSKKVKGGLSKMTTQFSVIEKLKN
jgi:SAM-dependent methyltransferase